MRFEMFDMAPDDDNVWSMLEREANTWECKIPSRIVGHGGPWPNSLAFSPDGSLLANGAFGHVGLVDTNSWKHFLDGRWNGSTGFDEATEHYKEYKAHYMEHWMSTVRFSPDGRTIYAAENSIHGTTYAWDVATGELRWRRADTSFHAISPDGKHLACSFTRLKQESVREFRSHDDMSESVLVLDAATGERVAEVSLTSTWRPYDKENDYRANFQPSAMAFSPDGRWLACGMAHPGWGVDPLVLVDDARDWSRAKAHNIPGFDKMVIERGEQLPWGGVVNRYGYLLYEENLSLTFSSEGRWLLRTDSLGARLWQIGNVVGDWRGGDRVGVYRVPGVAEPDGAYTLGAAFLGATGLIAITHPDSAAINTIEIVARTMDEAPPGTKRVHGTIGHRIAVFGCKSGMKSVAASPDGRWLAVGDWGNVQMCDLESVISLKSNV